ncbi:MAG: carbon storage regulator CsrA [Oligoflexales bacterium]|nr:carbon storage regulator CsrA [Oligoflexales bacterium]
MLVLTRKLGEAISIGDDITVVVMQIKGKQVRLGVEASANTLVHREEVFQRIRKENEKASQSSRIPPPEFSALLESDHKSRASSIRLRRNSSEEDHPSLETSRQNLHKKPSSS